MCEAWHSSLLTALRSAFGRDYLHQRNTFPLEKRVQNCYLPGRAMGLKEHEEVAGQRRLFKFHANGRVDGMVSREELINIKVALVHFPALV